MNENREVHICPILMKTIVIDKESMLCERAQHCGVSANECPIIIRRKHDKKEA